MVYRVIGGVVVASFLTILLFHQVMAAPKEAPKAWTLICYLNGDNDLGDEVLHAVEMLEQVGASEQINVVVMVDAHPGFIGQRSATNALTQTLYLDRNAQTGTPQFKALNTPTEQNMADPATLEAFVRTSRTQFPAERYLFATFTHGRGIIDYRNLSNKNDCVAGAICPDDTSRSAMSIDSFSQSIRNGMAGETLEMMVFFSCLTNMVEIGYGLRDLTRTLVASPAEIFLLNDPPGTFQIRGLRLERLLARLNATPAMSTRQTAEILIDDYVKQYTQNWSLAESETDARFPGMLAAMDVEQYGPLTRVLDRLAESLIDYTSNATPPADQLNRLRTLAGRVKTYRSFLNLEYVDVASMIHELAKLRLNDEISALLVEVETKLNRLVFYQRQSDDMGSSGVAVYFPDGRIPQNIMASHLGAYEQTAFGQQTRWASMIRQLHNLN